MNLDLDVNKVWVCCLGQGSVAAQDVATLLTRQLTRCGYQGRAWPSLNIVQHGSYEDPAAAHPRGLLTEDQQSILTHSTHSSSETGSSMAGAKPKTQAKPKAKPRSKAKAKPKTKAKTKAKPKPVSKAKAKPKTKTKAKAKPKPVSKAM
jgi:outer membrane biosynthesis protein TonB